MRTLDDTAPRLGTPSEPRSVRSVIAWAARFSPRWPLYFERMMVANGLQKGDYDTISAGVAAARYAALKAGVADAAVVLPPLNSRRRPRVT
jgi:hypothetical protein